MEETDNIMENIEKNFSDVNTNIYKSVVLTIDLSKYQNIKLYSSYSINPVNIPSDQIETLNKKIWMDRGNDLKHGLKICLRKLAKAKDYEIKDNVDQHIFEHPVVAVIRKSCEITVEILKTNDQYQSSKFSSGREWTISYSSEGEREKIEQEKWQEVADDINASMGVFFDAIGKKTDAPDKFAKLCMQKLVVAKTAADKDKKNLESQIEKPTEKEQNT